MPSLPTKVPFPSGMHLNDFQETFEANTALEFVQSPACQFYLVRGYLPFFCQRPRRDPDPEARDGQSDQYDGEDYEQGRRGKIKGTPCKAG